MDRIVELIKQEFESGEIAYIDAIEELIVRCKYSALDAECLVTDWEVDEES